MTYFTGEFYHSFKIKENIIPIPHKLFQKMEEENTLLNSFYKDSITRIPYPGKIVKEKRATNSSHEHKFKYP